MDRKEFLSLLGIGTAAVACGACLQGCKADDDIAPPPTNVDFTLDLTTPANSVLSTPGGYIYKDGLIVARVIGGAYVAVSQTCTHAGSTVYYDVTLNKFHCPNHGSNFNVDGSVSNGPATNSLRLYNTSLSGTTLRVFS